MTRGLFALFFACIIAGSLLPCHSQSFNQADQKHNALNRYVNFSNESIHILWAVHHRLEELNKDANSYIRSGGKYGLSFTISDIVRNYSYYGVLKGVCTKVYGVTDPEVNIKKLYELTSRDNSSIPQETLIPLNRNRDEMMYLMIELLSLCDTMETYTRLQRFDSDPGLSKVFATLDRCSTIFRDFQNMADKLFATITQAASPHPRPLDDLDRIIKHSRNILIHMRNENAARLVAEIDMLEQAIEYAEANKEKNKAPLKKLELYYDRDNMGYTHMIDYARQIVKRSREFFERPKPTNAYTEYSQVYYHYNERLLAVYNHHKYGIIAYYNRFIGFANQVLVNHIEETPLLEIIPAVEFYAEEEQILALPAPESEYGQLADGEPNTLEGAPANNLIFLLDVSASMSKPEKLGLLKESMIYILNLMRPEDQIAIVTYSGEAQVVLSTISSSRKSTILDAINNLRSSGGTNIRKGMKQAYNLAEKYFIPGGNNRIILASDGAFDLSGSTERLVSQMSDRNIQLSVFLFGKNEAPRTAEQLSELANLGGGNYFHITTQNANTSLLKEARAVRD